MRSFVMLCVLLFTVASSVKRFYDNHFKIIGSDGTHMGNGRKVQGDSQQPGECFVAPAARSAVSVFAGLWGRDGGRRQEARAA